MSTSRDGDDQKLTVPKFSSFKSASAAAAPSDNASQASRDHDRHRKRSRHDSDRHRDARGHRKEREHHSHLELRAERDSRRSRDEIAHRPEKRPRPADRHDDDRLQNLNRSRSAETSRTKPTRATPDGVPGLFLIDVQGDKLLKKYGADNRYWVPGYRRFPRGKVLGADGRLFIHRDGQREQFSILMPGEKPEFFRYRDGLRSKRPLAHPNPVRLSVPKFQADADEDVSYIEVVKSKKSARRPSLTESSPDEDGPSYRSIEGKMKAKQFSDSDEEEDSDDVVDVHQDNPLRWRSVQLNRQVKEHPEDASAWLELVDHQDALLRAGHDIDHTILENEAHSYAEIKVSMLESALSTAPLPQDRKRVLTRLMQEGVRVWDRKTATKKWAEVSGEERDSFNIWKTYLDYRMSDVATFQFEEVKDIMLARLSHLTANAASANAKTMYEEAIFVFLRLTRLVSDSGYTELAQSAWQALLEMNYSRPTDGDDPTLSLGAFQDFWESEVPRIGEPESMGWQHFVQTGGTGEPPEPKAAATLGEDSESRDAYKVWASLERKRQNEAKAPARTMDEGNDDDPFRVVMFSDIERFIFFFPVEVLGAVTSLLLDAYLAFSGLPPAFSTSSWTALTMRDPYLTGGYAPPNTEASWDLPIRDPDDYERPPPSFAKSILRCAISPDVLFPGVSSFRYLLLTTEHGKDSPSLAAGIVAQLVQKEGIEGLGQYSLALTSSSRPEGVKKHARALLKQYPTNIDLYNAYALAERAHGKLDVAENVLGSALGLAQGKNVVRLLLTWSWMKLELGDKTSALRCLCSMADEALRYNLGDNTTVSPTQTLKASQALKSETDGAMYSGDADGAGLYGECLMLFAYLTTRECDEPISATQGNISAAMDITRRISEDLRDRGLQRTAGSERLLQAAAKLLYWNASNGPFRRIYMRKQLSSFLSMFPQNGILLSLLEWSDSSLRVIDETREFIYEKCVAPPQDCVSNRIFAIEHEMARGNVNSTKAAFEQAVSSDVCQASTLLWVWYIQFSYSQKQLKPKAKDVFYRALRHCPWSKEIMMQAFVTLIRVMESDELRSVYNTMTSKGVRIHVELDEFLEKFQRSRPEKRSVTGR